MNQNKQTVKKSMKKNETDAASIIPIVQEKYKYVFNLFLRKTGVSDVAADLTQSLFLKLMRYHKNLRDPEAINYYIDKVASSCLCDYFQSLEAIRASQAAAYESAVRESGVSESAATLAEKAETSTILNAIFLELPAVCFECVCLRYLEGFSYKEIATKLRISVNSVGVYLSRARVILRENTFVRRLLEEE